jgi:PAS domain S-box-containing protein
VNSASQAIAFNAIPLLVLAVLYLFAAAALLPAFWRERGRLGQVELALALIYPCLGVAAALLGIAVLIEQEPLAGHVWLSLATILVALVPALAFLFRWSDRSVLLTGSRRVREAEEQTARRQQEREAINAFTSALARSVSADEVGRLVVDNVVPLLDVQFAALASIDGRWADGLAACSTDAPVDWWREVHLDLETASSAIASCAFEAAPLTIYDVESSAQVNRALADRVGARSAVFVPLISGANVVGVLVAATTGERRAFSPEEMALLGELAAESAIALEQTRSAAVLAETLERERLVAQISQRIRSEFDLDAVLGVAVVETARALPGASRCFIRLGEPGSPMPVEAEWHAEGAAPLGDAVERLPVANLAARERRTAAIGDVASAPELEDPTLGSTQMLLDLGTRSVLATPILVFDRLVGVFVVHRPDVCVWSESEIALAEAVAYEAGLAIHTARLLRENETRVKRQTALLNAAQVLTSELQFDSVIRRLVEEVVALVHADAADCWIFDGRNRFLVCRAVQGFPPEHVGRETKPEGVIGAAITGGRAVLARGTESADAGDAGELAEVMVAPITSLGEIRGVLRIASSEGGRFDDDDLEMLEAFASLASLALRNAEAFEEGSRQANVQRGFYRIASVLTEPLSLSATLDAVAQAANEAFGGDFALVLGPAAGRLELAGSDAIPRVLRDALAEGLPPGEQTLLNAAAEGRVVAAPSAPDDERFGPDWRALAERARYRSLLAIPIEVPGEAETSALALVFFGKHRAFTDDDLELAQHLAAAAKAALERSGVFEEERIARSLAQQLARTGGLLATELDPAAVLDEVVLQAPRLVGVEACAIRLLEGDELVVTAAAGDNVAQVVGARSPSAARLSGDVVQSGEPLAIEDVRGDERLTAADPILGLGYRSYLGVPLAAAEGVLHGVLSVYARRPRDWREAEIGALRALAGNASAALANAELYQRVALEKERNDAILANVADGIVAVDREGKVVLWNNRAEQITGVPAAEAIGRTPLEVLGRDLDAGPPNQPVTIVRGGDEVFLSVNEAVMRDPAAAVAGRIYAFRDVSTDRFVEHMKSEFVSTVSEQLRRPLTSIYGFAETLLRRDILFGEDERRTFLGYIAAESERLTTIVDALLNVARLDSGDLQVDVAPTDVGGVAREVVGDAEAWPHANGHRFVVDVPDEPVTAAADPEKLRLVLANLIDNAVKYSPDGGTITVVARRRRDAVELTVADEGVGIPEAEQQRIFRKFYRAESAAGREGGTGLGLFIVEGLVTAMKGRIRVTSTEGEGSTFTVELPVAEENATPVVNESEAQRV